jgi:formylglycine-generating enzyme required for sulfatase activity
MKRSLTLLMLLLIGLSACAPAPQPTLSPTLTIMPATETLADTPTPSLTPTPTLGIGTSQVAAADGMLLLYVPEGPFTMGTDEGYSNEGPLHTVTLPAFWVDRTEVTNGMYALCVQAGACEPPIRKTSNLIDYYYGFDGYVDYPVVWISWQNAANYCAWAGRRLPTEAEWEKAARGTDGRSFPWGASMPDETLVNFDYNLKDVSQVGAYPTGASPYGALDMAGNVQEWTADWYDEAYYAVSPEIDPTGPESGSHRVTRGGAFTSNDRAVQTTHRFLDLPEKPSFDIGFRCVVDALP